MVVIRGLDRLSGTTLEGLDDGAWRRHTAALQKLYDAEVSAREAAGDKRSVSFQDFASPFAHLPPLGGPSASLEDAPVLLLLLIATLCTIVAANVAQVSLTAVMGQGFALGLVFLAVGSVMSIVEGFVVGSVYGQLHTIFRAYEGFCARSGHPPQWRALSS